MNKERNTQLINFPFRTRGLIACFFVVLFSSGFTTNKKPMKEVINKALKQAEEQSLLMAQKYSEAKEIFPRSYVKGTMTTSGADWWCSGFFPGVLWYLYENSKNPELLSHAKDYTSRIEKEKNNTSTHDLGFMLYCSYGNGFRLTGDSSYKQVLLKGVESLASRFKPMPGLIRSWDFGKWQYPVIIDNMMNLEYLLWAAKVSGNTRYSDICISHADKTMQNHYRLDYSCYHVVSYDTITGKAESRENHQGYSDESAWSRGQAWGLYSYTFLYRETRNKRYLNEAIHIANYIFNQPNMPKDYIPYWDFMAPKIPNEPRDASAAAVMASSLIDLSSFVDSKLSKQYLRIAEIQLRTLASANYTAKIGQNGNFILMHSVGFYLENSEIDAPLTYADYYYVEALIKMKNKLTK